MVKILSSQRQDGTRSRSMSTAQLIGMLGALQVGLSQYFNTALPPEYHWVYGTGMIVLSMWLAFLRHDTTQPMA